MKRLLFLLLITSFSNVASYTMFNAKGSLFCEYEVTWCFFVSMWEEDMSILINTDDLIGKEGIRCITDKYSFDYLIEGLQYSDGPFDNFYEIYITVTHNCTQGDLKQVTQETSLESIFNRNVQLRWDVDLTDEGVVVDEFF